MTYHTLVGALLFLAGAAFSQFLSFGVAAFLEARRRKLIDDTLGPIKP